MAVCKPLAYDSLKSVLQYMDPNVRFQLSCQIPSIRSAEKATPLHVNSLWLNQNEVAINSITYRVEVIRKYKDGNIPYIVRLANKSRRQEDQITVQVGYDLNIAGGRDWTTEDIITPGDLVIEALDEDEQLTQEETRNRRSQKLFEEMIAIKVEDRLKNMTDISIEMEEIKQKVLIEDFGCDYSTYLQLTVEGPVGELIMSEKLEYNHNIPQTMKYLLNKFLGGRNYSVQLNHFSIINETRTLRLPEGIKLRIRSIGIGSNVASVFNSLSPIIDEASFPFCNIYINGTEVIGEPENYKNSMIQNAEYLQVIRSTEQVQWFPMLFEIPVLQVHLECGNFPKDDFITLLENWLQNGKEIGAVFSFGLNDESEVKELLDFANKKPTVVVEEIIGHGCLNFPNVIVIPMKSDSELCIYCVEEDNVEYYFPWELNITVTTTSHRQLWNVNYCDTYFD